MGSFSTFEDAEDAYEDLITQVPVSVTFVDPPSTELIKSPSACLPLYLRDDVLGVVACPRQR
jgi:hypothetical protein